MTKNIRRKKSPGGRLLIHSSKKRTSASHCKICGKTLQINMNKKTKSGKHSSRPFGGKICHSCLKNSINALEIQ